jgi:hypothetical protein
MRVENQIREAEELIQWLDSNIDGLDLPANDRMRLAAGCLDMALEHQKSIVLLTANSLFGSAAALVRSEFEAYVRGVWLLYCASDLEIEKFKKDKLEKNIGQLIEDIEKHDAFNVGTLSHVKQTSWKAMNSFTHSGLYQIIRRNTASEITPNYTDAELIDALDTAISFGILTAIAISDMARNEALAKKVFNRGQEFFNK